MPLDPTDFSDMLSRAIPDDLPEDPHVSYRPKHLAPEPPPKRDPSATTVQPARWRVAEGSSKPPVAEGSNAYALARKLGRGGFGEVWEAVQASLGRIVAVKRLREDHVQQAAEVPHEGTRMVGDFRREALTTALLEHPNIVPVHDLGVDEEGRPLLAMKLVNGERWDEMLKHDFAAMPVDDYLAKHLPIFMDMCQAVAFAHARGIVHRDLKPSQVMVGEFGEVLLMDWGLAVLHDPALAQGRFQDDVALLVPTPAQAFNPTGTAAFMAIEQTLETAEGIGPWTDTYLLGGTLFYMLAKKAPHAAPSALESFVLASVGYVDPPEKRAPDREIPRELSAIAMKALSKNVADRYASARDLMAAVQDYMAGAGARRESARLAEEARRVVDAGPSSYAEFEECNSLLLRAQSLWPRNAEAAELRQRVLEGFAEMALLNNDLVLAGLMAESVADEETRKTLLKRTEQQRRLNAANARQRRVLAAVTATLLVVICVDVAILAGWRTGAAKARERQIEELRASEKAARERVAELEKQLGIEGGKP